MEHIKGYKVFKESLDTEILNEGKGQALADKYVAKLRQEFKNLNDEELSEFRTTIAQAFDLNESFITEAATYRVPASDFGKSMWEYYQVKGEKTWRVHCEYAIDQVKGDNDPNERDVVFFEAFPAGDDIYVKIGGINNLKKSNGSTYGKNFATTVEEFRKNPDIISSEAAKFLTDKDHLKWLNKNAKSEGQKIQFILKDDYTEVIKTLINKAIGLRESVNEGREFKGPFSKNVVQALIDKFDADLKFKGKDGKTYGVSSRFLDNNKDFIVDNDGYEDIMKYKDIKSAIVESKVNEAEFKHINRDEHNIKLAIKDVEKKSRLKINRGKEPEYEQLSLNKIMLSKVLGREKLGKEHQDAWEKLKKEYNLKGS